MKLHPAFASLALFLAASAIPAFAQVSWSNQSPAGLTDGIWCATYANGTFAAVTDQGKVLTSADGLTWSSQTVSQGTWLVSIAYGNSKWVAVGAGGTILVSSDLKTWVNATAATSSRLNGVLYNGSVWVAVGEAATIITSPDALNWSVLAAPAGDTGFLHGITWDPVNSVFLITGEATATVPIDTGGGGVMLQLAVNGTTYSVSNVLPAQGYPLEAVTYQSGVTPNTVASGGNAASSGAGHGFIISGSYGQSSPTIAAGIPNVDFRGLTYGNGYWVAAGEQGTLLSSTDGVTWTQRFAGNSPSTVTTASLLSATYSSTLQRFVVTGTGGTILVSNSPPTVFINVSTRGYVSSSVTGAVLDGGFVIAGTAPRTILIRADGPVLSTFGVAGSLADPVLTVYNGSGGVVATNTGWTTNANPTAVSTAALETGAFALPNPGKDSALLLTLQPGAYTVVVSSAGGNSGIALFEAYAD
jgi:hypothetical protein